MSVEAVGTINSLDDVQIQKIFKDLHKRLNLSVDFESYEPGGQQFWSQLETDLVKTLGINSINDVEEGKRKLVPFLEDIIKEEQLLLDKSGLEDLLAQITDHYFGYGVLESLLRDDFIYGININGFQDVYFERKGRMNKASIAFWNDAHLKHVIDRLCIVNHASLPSDVNPITTFSLPDNSSVTIVFPPITPDSLFLSISRQVRSPITIEKLVQYGSVSAEMLQFLKASVEAHLNILVCGRHGSGADTIVNILSSFIPGEERVVSIEYENNYMLKVNHLVKLIVEGDPSGENSYTKLLTVANKLRGDRLVLGRFLYTDVYDALNAVNDNFSGSILRTVAKSPADAINRLEALIQMDKSSLPIGKIRGLIGDSLDLIVYQERLRDGSRVVKNIAEVVYEPDGNQVVLRDIYTVEQTGIKEGRIVRKFTSHEHPSDALMDKITDAGINLPPEIFSIGEADQAVRLTEIERRAIKFSRGKYAFVSYSKDDRERVRALVKELEKNGFDIWLDMLNIKPGEEWTKILENAIKNAGVFLVILTPSSVNSQFVRNEIIMAQDEKLPIIPVKMDDCDVPIQIRALQYILYDKHDTPATLAVLSEILSKFISNKQILGDM